MDTPEKPVVESLIPGPYHGVHVAPLQKGHEKIRWLPPAQRSDRVRVRRHTCECKATIYELCHSGGLMFIRRTVRGPDGAHVHESDRLVTARMEVLWLRLLLGEAR
ncbi:hypothetical protein [Microtetraspora niveoalba]|uniref:hypothetical protein n=1 Tax=Microtetraspora niveoalba TaxID=46175 RepID=UPI00082A3550|nr:hypothetical protein [Microtetraspora niveoalba]